MADPVAFRIFACALRDRMVAQAMAGDAEAMVKLLRFVPTDLPESFRRAERARRIRDIAADLRATMPDVRPFAIARMIAEAGHRLQIPGRGLDGPPFDCLTDDERGDVQRQVIDILAWSPPSSTGNRWIGIRQILNLF